MTKTKEDIQHQTIELLQKLIGVSSFSKEEDQAADIIRKFLKSKKIPFETKLNNTWVKNKHYNFLKPSILLNSHIDTVKPVSGWSKDPFQPSIEDQKLYGLGSNDAGAALISLLATFLHFYESEDLKYNLIFAATSEEEISGKNGIENLPIVLCNVSLDETEYEKVKNFLENILKLKVIEKTAEKHDETLCLLYFLNLRNIQVLQKMLHIALYRSVRFV
jgi:hypothetical protein